MQGDESCVVAGMSLACPKEHVLNLMCGGGCSSSHERGLNPVPQREYLLRGEVGAGCCYYAGSAVCIRSFAEAAAGQNRLKERLRCDGRPGPERPSDIVVCLSEALSSKRHEEWRLVKLQG